MKSKYVLFVVLSAFLLISCAGNGNGDLKVIADKKISDGLKVEILNPEGKLKNGEQSIGLRFTDAKGKPVEIKAASLNFNMPAMGSMAEMNDAAKLNTTGTAGSFTGTVDLQMAGEWIAQVSYEGAETGKTTINMTAY